MNLADAFAVRDLTIMEIISKNTNMLRSAIEKIFAEAKEVWQKEQMRILLGDRIEAFQHLMASDAFCKNLGYYSSQLKEGHLPGEPRLSY